MADKDDGTERQHWHLDKKVPISLIITILSLGISGIWAIADVKKDVELIKADLQVLHQRDERASVDLRDALKTMQDNFTRLDAKLDRLIERKL